jgi:hypothetical protein
MHVAKADWNEPQELMKAPILHSRQHAMSITRQQTAYEKVSLNSFDFKVNWRRESVRAYLGIHAPGRLSRTAHES